MDVRWKIWSHCQLHLKLNRPCIPEMCTGTKTRWRGRRWICWAGSSRILGATSKTGRETGGWNLAWCPCSVFLEKHSDQNWNILQNISRGTWNWEWTTERTQTLPHAGFSSAQNRTWGVSWFFGFHTFCSIHIVFHNMWHFWYFASLNKRNRTKQRLPKENIKSRVTFICFIENGNSQIELQ